MIGFAYKASTGKDTAAQVLVDLGWQKLAFADPIREVVCDLKPAVARLVSSVGWDSAKRLPSVRYELDRTGRVLRHRLGDHVLIDATLAKATEGTCISDVRYVAEAEAILALGGQVVRVDRDVPDLHLASEHELDGWDGWSKVIKNSGSLEDLAAQVLAL